MCMGIKKEGRVYLWREREELRSEGRREKDVRWNDVCKCSRCV